jgi:hypothetical protein
MSSTPTNGQPWNFNALLETYLIPRTIAADKKLPPGARLLWGVIRQHSMGDGRCNRSDETLAQLLAVSDRQLRRYTKVLESAGLLRTTPRPGKTPLRELLWDSRFAGKIRAGVDTYVRGGGQIRPGGWTDPSTLYKEDGSLSGSFKVNRTDVFKTPSANASAPAQPKPAAEWTEAEYIARGRACGFPEDMIERDLERLRRRKANGKSGRLTKASEVLPELGAIVRP